MKSLLCICTILASVGVLSTVGRGQLNQVRGNAPGNVPQTTFFVHQLGSDHAEGITTIDMNADGRPDILSGAYWYENPGPGGGEWKRHQFRTVEITGEFVSDCGEWAVDVNHDGAPDLVTVGWMTDGLWWYENPRKPGVLWQRHLIAHTIETEGGWMADINGDGKPDLALAHYGRSGMFWVDFAGAEPKVHRVGGHDEDGHELLNFLLTVGGLPDPVFTCFCVPVVLAIVFLLSVSRHLWPLTSDRYRDPCWHKSRTDDRRLAAIQLFRGIPDGSTAKSCPIRCRRLRNYGFLLSALSDSCALT